MNDNTENLPTLESMTGFARVSGTAEGYRWEIELKSVNGKGLDARVRIPTLVDGIDLAIKKLAGKYLTRGTVYINCNVTQENHLEDFVINEKRLQTLIDTARKHQGDGFDIGSLLAIKGVVELASKEMNDTMRERLEKAILASSEEGLCSLKKHRQSEGNRIKAVLLAQLDEIETLTNEARDGIGDRLEAMRARFQEQLNRLYVGDQQGKVSDDRLVQEIAILAVKADIQEEIDRLDSHIVDARELLSSSKAVGRRLDFLCQELNRETNTLCSKSTETDLTRIGLDLKSIIDQFREQIQNIE